MPFPSFSPPSSAFPTYLTNPLSFRRKSSSSSAASASTAPSSPISPDGISVTAATPLPVPAFLPNSKARLRCSRCLTDLALTSQIISKGFTGRHGRAYLVAPPDHLQPAKAGCKGGDLPNTYTHRAVPRQLVTGQHTVGDISCAQCGCVLGWKYVGAEEEGQKYKVGKFILEGKRVVCWGGWEDEGEEVGEVVTTTTGEKERKGTRFEEDEIEFDSQDEDECEDLFMGVWTPQGAARRRRMKRFGRG